MFLVNFHPWHATRRIVSTLSLAILTLGLTLGAATSALATTYTDLAAPLIDVRGGSVDWGDYDGDGDLDAFVHGSDDGSTDFTRIYRNDNGTFVDAEADLFDYRGGPAKWGDYDNDGDLDIMAFSLNWTILYRNDGGTFSFINPGLPRFSSGGMEWGDYDNDGDLDIAVAGWTGEREAAIYENDGGTFTLASTLLGVDAGDISWGDYDGDLDLDLALTGRGADNAGHSIIYRNDNGSFVDIGAALVPVTSSSVDWGDFDADGDLDLLLCGNEEGFVRSKIYENQAGAFVESSISLPGNILGDVEWGDHDNDGDLDILMTGQANGTRTTQILVNEGATFTPMTTGLLGVWDSAATWGDYDADGDLDILLIGLSEPNSGSSTRIYRNDGTTPNAAPAPPTSLTSSEDAGVVTFSWNAGSDTETATAALSYNIRVGTTPGGSEITSAMSDVSTGLRQICRRGNAQLGTSWALELPAGVYYWSVQTIDAGFQASAFAEERIHVPEPTYVELGTSLPGARFGSVDWGDYDNDGDLDALVHGADDDYNPVNEVYRNDNGTFVNVDVPLVNHREGPADWVDFDNDGDLDLAIFGFGFSRFYENDGGSFNPLFLTLPVPGLGGADWGDYDNDGDLDFVVAGWEGYRLTQVFENEGGSFTLAHDLEGLSYGEVEWGDFDNDGDLDLALAGNGDNGDFSTILRNDDGDFVDIEANLIAGSSAALAWGDHDADGDLDIVLSVNDSGFPTTRLYNNDAGSFTDSGISLPNMSSGDLQWGDFDNDGDLDLLMSGLIVGSMTTQIMVNDGGSFSVSPASFLGVGQSDASFGDYDADGDLDLILCGLTEPWSGASTRIYRNDTPLPNAAPAAPANLQAAENGGRIVFSWDAGSDATTSIDGLSYNLRVGTTPGGNEILSAMAEESNGYRLVAHPGNTGPNLEWPLSLDPGTYYWSVQTIDAGHAGSAFAAEEVFALETTDAPDTNGDWADGGTHILSATVYPNPVVDQAVLAIETRSEGPLQVDIYDAAGRRVRSLEQTGRAAAGRHVLDLVPDGAPKLAPGVYLYKITSENETAAGRFISVR